MNLRTAAAAAICCVLPSVATADKVVGVEAVASSTAKGKADKFAAWRAVDDQTETAWCEGKPDEGLDETITLTLAEPIKVTRLDLYVGLHGSAKEYDDNNRVAKVSARTAPKTGEPLVQLAKAVPIVSKHNTLVKLDLKTPRTVQVIELGIAGVTRGAKAAANDTCFSDISFATEKGEVVRFLYGISGDAMSQLAPSLNVLRTALAGCEQKQLAFMVAFPFEHRIEAEEDSRTIRHKDVKSLVKACRKDAVPAIPVEADKLSELTSSGFGRITFETGGNSDLYRMEMRWVDGSWKLASIDTH